MADKTSFDSNQFYHDSSARKAKGIADFSYSETATTIHRTLDPRRINSKVGGVLESRDSVNCPESTAVLICFDVTGSNYDRAKDAQKALPRLMNMLPRYLQGAQIAVAANDDCKVVPDLCIQISEFETGNLIDENIRNILLVGQGGGNEGESYDLLLYAAARKVALDCLEKRGKKGKMFIYADEPFFKEVSKDEVFAVYGDKIPSDIPIETIIAEAQEKFEIYVAHPATATGSYYTNSFHQYVKLFGEPNVFKLEHPEAICEWIAVTIGMSEDQIDAHTAVTDLVTVGRLDSKTASDIVQALVPLSRSRSVAKVAGGALSTSAGTRASRL